MDTINHVLNRKRQIKFGTLVEHGWFSATPDDTSVNRAIRTNNPGALNITNWQKKRPGYVGYTEPDTSGNMTTIYKTPEHGISAWYHLISEIYGLSELGKFEIKTLARRYAGSDASEEAVQAYINGWSHWSEGHLTKDTVVHLQSDDEMIRLAKALFAHEAGATIPLHDDQILYAIQSERQPEVRVFEIADGAAAGDELIKFLLAAIKNDKIEETYENGLDQLIIAFGENLLQDANENNIFYWLNIFAPISDISLEGPADITLELYKNHRDEFLSAMKKLPPDALFEIEDFISAINDEGLSFEQLEIATRDAISKSTNFEILSSTLPVLAKFIINQENTERKVKRYTGYLTILNQNGNEIGRYNATTGGFVASYRRKNGPTPPGYFIVSRYRTRTKQWATRDGVGYTFDLDEINRTGKRSAFRIHPDGAPPGTHGCIGIVEDAEKLKDCRDKIKANLSSVQEFRLLVEYGR